jgi:RNA polymerase sigma factor (sigma-70 family)
MPRGDLNALARYLRRAAGDPTARELTDAQLLDRYLGCQDHNAFAMLVRRHGSMVRSVCRNVLHHEHDADDAFQATFLVLASKAASIREATALASWLHGVAFRTAMKAKKARKRYAEQQDCEGGTADQAATAASLREVQAIVDEELNRLAEKYRAPFVLCCLEGKSRAEAATELGWKEGTVSSRLAQARKELQKRLTRRGVALTAAMCAVELSRTAAAAAVGPALRGRTIEAALAFAAGKAVGGELMPAQAAVLAKAVMHGMLATKLKITTVLVVAIGLTASAGALAIGPQWSGARPDRVTQPTQAAWLLRPNVGKQPRTDSYGNALPAAAIQRMGTADLRHESTVFFVTFLADGRQALSAGEDGLVRLWDVATGKEIRGFGALQPVPPDKAVLSVALSPDGRVLATSHGEGVVRLREIATGKELKQLKELPLTVAALALSPDGKTVAAAGPEGPVVLWDIATDKVVRVLDAAASASEDNPRMRDALASKIADGVLRPNGPGGAGQGIWNIRAKPHLAFSADGKTMLSATLGIRGSGIRTAIKLWDVATGKELCRVEPEKLIAVSAALSADGKTIAWTDQDATGGGNVHLLEAATGKETHCMPAAGKAYMPYTVTPETGMSGKIQLIFPGAGTRFVFGPDSRTLITRAVGGQVVLWDVATGKELRRLGQPLPPATWSGGISFLSQPGLAVSPDGNTLAVAGDGNAVTLLDLVTGLELHGSQSHQAAIREVYYSGDGKTLTALSGDGTARSWTAASAEAIRVTRMQPGMLTSALSPDGRILVSAGLDGKVQPIHTTTGKEQGAIDTELRSALRLAVSPDGRTLAAGTSNNPTIHIFDIATGKKTVVLEPRQKEELQSRGVVIPFRIAPAPIFSADGKRLAGPGRGALCIWDVVDGREIREIPVPKGFPISSAVFAPDGRSIAQDMDDGTVALWEVATGKERRRYGQQPNQRPRDPLPGAPPGFAAPLPWTDPVLLAISRDGRLLAHGRGKEVLVWDVATGKELGRLNGHNGAVFAGVFAPDGKTLASAGADTTVLVWETTAFTAGAGAVPDLTVESREAAWSALAGPDAAKAFDAIVALAASHQEAQFLSERLKPAAAADAERVDRLVADLDSNKFALRQKATDELKDLGRQAVPALKKALAAQPTLETRRRIEALLDLVSDSNLSADNLRLVRAVEALERMASPEARMALQRLAGGAPAALGTEAAQEALRRLSKY